MPGGNGIIVVIDNDRSHVCFPGIMPFNQHGTAPAFIHSIMVGPDTLLAVARLRPDYKGIAETIDGDLMK